MAERAPMTWLEMLEKRVETALPNASIPVDAEAKRAIALEVIERLRPYDGLTVVIDEEPVYPWWLEEEGDE